jgi:hypothetical protein
MVETLELSLILIGVLFIGVLIFAFFKTFYYGRQLTSNVITRGLNGVGGSTVNITCPSGQNITVNKANYICTSGTNIESSGCDPYYQSNGQQTTFFNPNNTLDVTSTLATQCNGKSSCSIAIPSSQAAICAQKGPGTNDGGPCTGQIQLIGTYDCGA